MSTTSIKKAAIINFEKYVYLQLIYIQQGFDAKDFGITLLFL